MPWERSVGLAGNETLFSIVIKISNFISMQAIPTDPSGITYTHPPAAFHDTYASARNLDLDTLDLQIERFSALPAKKTPTKPLSPTLSVLTAAFDNWPRDRHFDISPSRPLLVHDMDPQESVDCATLV